MPAAISWTLVPDWVLVMGMAIPAIDVQVNTSSEIAGGLPSRQHRVDDGVSAAHSAGCLHRSCRAIQAKGPAVNPEFVAAARHCGHEHRASGDRLRMARRATHGRAMRRCGVDVRMRAAAGDRMLLAER